MEDCSECFGRTCEKCIHEDADEDASPGEAPGSAASLAGLTNEEYVEITTLREMTIRDAGIRGLQRFIELGNKVIDALILEQNER